MNEPTNASLEFELIVLCCRAATDELACRSEPDLILVSRVNALLGLVCGSTDGVERITALCRQHQVGPMVYRGLLGTVGGTDRPCHSSRDSGISGEAWQGGRAPEGKDDATGGCPASEQLRRIECEHRKTVTALMAELEEQYLASLLRNERLLRHVLAVLRWFAADGVRAVPFKGPIMSQQLYNDIAVRPCSDLDVIVHEDDLTRALQLLEKRGFRSIRAMTSEEDAIWRQAGWGYDMSSPDGEYTVDISARVTPEYLPYRLSADVFWGETREVSVGGRPIGDDGGRCSTSGFTSPSKPAPVEQSGYRVMSPELTLIFLCWHGTKHLWDRLVWLADVSALIRCPGGLDWTMAETLMEQSGTRRMVEVGVGMALRVFGDENVQKEGQLGWVLRETDRRSGVEAGNRPEPGTGVSDCWQWAKALDGRQQVSEERALRASTDMCLGRLSGEAGASWWQEQLFFLRMWSTRRERVMVVLRTLFRPTISDYQAVRLPQWLSGLYYIIRPFRLLWKVARKTSG